MHTIHIQFEDEDHAIAWFLEARKLGALAERAGLRHKDSLDYPRGRAAKGELIVTAEVSPAGWLVEPAHADPERGAALVRVLGEYDKVSCPACEGFGYHEDGTVEGRECETCHGDGTIPRQAVSA